MRNSFFFFFRKVQMITVLLLCLICNFYIELKHNVCLYIILCVGFSIFNIVLFLLQVIFLFSKTYGLFWIWNIITSLRIKIIEKLHTLLLPHQAFDFQVATRSFKIQWYLSWWQWLLVTNFLNLQRHSHVMSNGGAQLRNFWFFFKKNCTLYFL